MYAREKDSVLRATERRAEIPVNLLYRNRFSWAFGHEKSERKGIEA